MIKFLNLCQDAPYTRFKKEYDIAIDANQENIEAISISSYSTLTNEINSRFVNLKIIDDKNFIFFSNYNSPKSIEFDSHSQISALFFWASTNTQVRMKANINKTLPEYNQIYFSDRAPKKNALAISSNQSKKTNSYEEVLKKYDRTLKLADLKDCPNFWGGFSFNPYYFEFWKGDESRINKREVYEKNDDKWDYFLLQP